MLAPLKVGGPYTLRIWTDDLNDTVMFTQVMVGEVWITAGQSNSIMTVEQSAEYDKAVAERTKYPNIRVVLISNRMPHEVVTPQKQFSGYWGPLKWENSIYTVPRSSGKDIPGGSSALSYYFARELYKYMDGKVPVGMIELGAILPVEAWIDDATVAETPEIAHLRGLIYPNATSRAYNAEVAPLAPFPVRGVIYYQGEMNSGRGLEYRSTLPMMIKSWRKSWGNPDMPFIIVQLPGFIVHRGPEDKRLDMDAKTLAQFTDQNVNHGYCGVREAQLMTWQKTSNTGMAITIDLGDPYDIHPKRKRQVSERVFLQARQLVYGEKSLVASGPVPEKFEVKDGRFVVSFKFVGSGLKAKGKMLEGFEVSADGKTFVPARAEIQGNTVVVWSADVVSPKAVRYDWAGYPVVSLYNAEGLPATPFRYPVGS
jgi:sialate O-acetylesterase